VLTRLDDITARVAKALHVTGPFNLQVLWKDDALKVIECNLRASRRYVTFPILPRTHA
jgi:carbamoylphosphate synthase large subunit